MFYGHFLCLFFFCYFFVYTFTQLFRRSTETPSRMMSFVFGVCEDDWEPIRSYINDGGSKRYKCTKGEMIESKQITKKTHTYISAPTTTQVLEILPKPL